MSKQFHHLGHKSILSEKQIAQPRTILDTFENPKRSRDYEVRFTFPEFTSMCPVTGQPDFARITITYVPHRLCVEMKSLKLYFLAYPNKAAADKGWKGFREDPVWQKAQAESEKDGKLVKKVDSVYMNPTDYSPMK